MDKYKKFICRKAFTAAEIHSDGKIFPCCPAWINYYEFGNVFDDSLDTIFNGEKAQEFRKSIMDGSYKYCNLDYCQGLSSFHVNTVASDFISANGTSTKYPSFVKFCHDVSCNFKCVTCRDNHKVNSDEKTQYLNSLIDTHFLPLLKDADVISLNGSGEVFASEHCKELIKRTTQAYPDIKFDLHTNGSLCSEKTCMGLGILDRLTRVQVSVNAASGRLHKKVTRSGSYKEIVKNLKWLSGLKKQGKLKEFRLVFVVSGLNYMELKPFMKMGIDLDAVVDFWEYRKWGTELDKDYEKLAVFKLENRNYMRLAKIMEDDVFRHPLCCMDNVLREVSVKNAHRRVHE